MSADIFKHLANFRGSIKEDYLPKLKEVELNTEIKVSTLSGLPEFKQELEDMGLTTDEIRGVSLILSYIKSIQTPEGNFYSIKIADLNRLTDAQLAALNFDPNRKSNSRKRVQVVRALFGPHQEE